MIRLAFVLGVLVAGIGAAQAWVAMAPTFGGGACGPYQINGTPPYQANGTPPYQTGC